MDKPCGRCGRMPRLVHNPELDYQHYESFDYCLNCLRDRCPECAAKGCCGSVPMESGMEYDYRAETRGD